MMREAAGLLEKQNTQESALRMLRKKNQRKIAACAKSPVAFQKWKGTTCPKSCVMTSDKRPTKSHIHIS